MVWIKTYEDILLNWDQVQYLTETYCHNAPGTYDELIATMADGQELTISIFPDERYKSFDDNDDEPTGYFFVSSAQDVFTETLIDLFSNHNGKKVYPFEEWFPLAKKQMYEKAQLTHPLPTK